MTLDETSGGIPRPAQQPETGGLRAVGVDPSRPPNHHARLKQETAELHKGVEEAVDRLNPFASVERYRRFILNNLAFYRAFEDWAEACGVRALLDDWPERRKQGLLTADAQALAAFPEEVPETPQRMMPAAPARRRPPSRSPRPRAGRGSSRDSSHRAMAVARRGRCWSTRTATAPPRSGTSRCSSPRSHRPPSAATGPPRPACCSTWACRSSSWTTASRTRRWPRTST